jgi:hypothetical protein
VKVFISNTRKRSSRTHRRRNRFARSESQAFYRSPRRRHGQKGAQQLGPDCFDAELDKDGKAFRPDGKRACTLIPPTFGLAGVNLHTWTGFGSVTYWNAYVAATEMHGSGTFFDARLYNAEQYPVAAKSGSGNTRGKADQVTSKLAALTSISSPSPGG